MTSPTETTPLLAPKALGDCIISLGALQYLASELSETSITVFSDRDWIFADACRGPIDLQPEDRSPPGAVNLDEYLEYLPHRRDPPTHHVISVLRALQPHLPEAFDLPSGVPIPSLTPRAPHVDAAREELARLEQDSRATGRALVWICGRSTTPNRNPDRKFWLELADALEEKVLFLDILGPDEVPFDENRIPPIRLHPLALASFMPLCDAGVAVDTFGLHLAAASGAQRVIAVLSSSHPTCVCYPGNRFVYRTTERTRVCQPCGNHGYAREGRVLETFEGPHPTGFLANGCLWEDIPCLKAITPGDLVIALGDWIGAG